MTRYEHTQTGYVMVWGLFVVAYAVASGRFFEASPARQISLVISVLLLIAIVFFYKLTITIENETLCASFGVGLIRKKLPVSEIAGCEPIRIRWWYGWGIYLTPDGWLYNVAGWDAVAITLRDGLKFAFGTDDPDGLISAIRDAISCGTLPKPSPRFREISFVDLEPDEFFHAAALRRDGRISDTEKWIEHSFDASRAYRAVQFDAPLRELNWECRRMRTFFLAALNRFIRNKPSIAAAAQIASVRMPPSVDVAFVLIWHAQSEPIHFDAAGFREMKNVFVTIVKKSF